jgi:hypothetical protein
LAPLQDRSAYTVALLRFLIRYCTVSLPSDAQILEEEEDEERLAQRARQELSFEMFEIVKECLSHVRQRYDTMISSADELNDAECAYHPNVHNGRTILFGIPATVVASETRTILWIEWLWSTNAWRKFVSLPAAEETASTTVQTTGLTVIFDNLWRAKSALLSVNYYEFFDVWDRERLLPLLVSIEEAR